jgi:hypothetical protein
MTFEQHAVPQNIASYHFRLVGDMTLKQFFELAAGAIVGLIIYAAPFPGIIRWPLIVISILFGAALAFLPIQDRPLEQWVKAFIQAIYAPTVFFWQKDDSIQYFKLAEAPGTQAPTPQLATTTAPASAPEANLEEAEAARLAKIAEAMKNPSAKLDLPQTPMQSDLTINTPAHQAAVGDEAQSLKRDEIAVPNQGAVQIQPKGFAPKEAPEEVQTASVTGVSQPMLAEAQKQKAASAQFSEAASPPANPHTPNTVVGQVVSNEGKIIENAILEVKDSQGRPVRALKSNAAGHFRIVTPLLDGQYIISTDKEGLKFEPVSFVAKGEVIEPIIIKPTTN